VSTYAANINTASATQNRKNNKTPWVTGNVYPSSKGKLCPKSILENSSHIISHQKLKTERDLYLHSTEILTVLGTFLKPL